MTRILALLIGLAIGSIRCAPANAAMPDYIGKCPAPANSNMTEGAATWSYAAIERGPNAEVTKAELYCDYDYDTQDMAKQAAVKDGVICKCDVRRGFAPICVAIVNWNDMETLGQCFGVFPCAYYGTCAEASMAQGIAAGRTVVHGPITKAMLQRAEKYEPVAVFHKGKRAKPRAPRPPRPARRK